MKAFIRSSALQRYIEETWRPPFPQDLPSSADRYLSQNPLWRMAFRRAMRELNLYCHGQSRLVRARLDPAVHRRVLWIHQGTPQVGDSLTDLAGRVLLKGKLERFDLLTDAHLLPLYRSDDVFTQVGSTAAELHASYDLILLHSASSRSVRDKLAHFRDTPFAHIHGYFTGPEFNRTLYGFYRLAQLLELPLPAEEIQLLACPSMRASIEEEAAVDALQIPGGAIGLAIGGVRDWCTYQQWPEVLRGLFDAGIRRPVVLIGSDNGLAMRDQILKSQPGMKVIDRVAQQSLGEVHALMRRCALVVCADGGLLHVAHTTGVPVTTLFAGISEPRFRITAANKATRWRYGNNWVNDVPARELVECIVAQLGELRL